MAEKRKDSKGRNLRTGESERKDGRYMYRWTQNGKEKCVYALTLGELREKEKQIQRDIEDGIDGKAAGSITVNDMFEKCIGNKKELRESVKADYINKYNWYIRSSLGGLRVNRIKYSDVKAFYFEIIEKKEIGFGTVCSINTVLSAVFQLAVKDGIIRNNPCAGILGEMRGCTKAPEKRRALTTEEQAAFMGYVSNSKTFYHYYPVFVMLLGTGMRIGELGGLCW